MIIGVLGWTCERCRTSYAVQQTVDNGAPVAGVGAVTALVQAPVVAHTCPGGWEHAGGSGLITPGPPMPVG